MGLNIAYHPIDRAVAAASALVPQGMAATPGQPCRGSRPSCHGASYGANIPSGAVHAARFAIDAAASRDDVEVQSNVFALRDIWGNPFQSVALDASWLAWNDGTIRKLAQPIYDHRAFDRLPLLADALEDAGCTDADILGHCRSGGEHVRGCWVIDLLLGKT